MPDHVPPDHLVDDAGVLLLFLVLAMLQCGLLPAVISANLEIFWSERLACAVTELSVHY